MSASQIPEITAKLPEDFTTRPAALDDSPEITTLVNLASQQVAGYDEFGPDELHSELQKPGFEIEKDSLLVFSPEGELVGYQDVFTFNTPPVQPVIWGCTHPGYQGLGIGTYLMEWAIQRAHHVLDEVPPDVRVIVRATTYHHWTPAIELMESLGMTIRRHYLDMEIEMEAEPPAPQWPEGIRIHTYQHPDEAEAVYRAIDDSFSDHFGYVAREFEFGFQQFQHMRLKDPGFDPGLWFLAKDGEEIAGISLCRKFSHEDPDSGLVDNLGVRRAYRRRGLALALLHHSFGAYWQRGKKRVILGVDAGSLTGATRLYEKAGMKPYRQTDLYELEIQAGKDLTRNELE